MKPKGDLNVILILLLFSFGLVVCCGGDSWLHPHSLHMDPSWFFMAGKSWMNGLIPYVDFTDSKGPLLWLIYGLGYLISPHNFYGVLIFEVLSYWLTFFVLYRIAQLFLRNTPQSMIASMLMGIIYFYPGMHQEMRIEDFCHLFNAIAMFILLKYIYFNNGKPIYAVYLGICLGCTLMMKYSYFLTLLIPSGMIFLYLISQKKNWRFFLLRFFIGLMVIVLPFAIYFLLFADIRAFINEYFLNTGSTILNIWEYTDEEFATIGIKYRWPVSIVYLFVRDNYVAYFMTLIAVGTICDVYLLRRSKWTASTIILWYTLSLILFSVMGLDHYNYYLNLCVFGFSLCLLIVYPLKRLTMGETILGGGVIVGLMTIIVTFYIYSEHAYGLRDKMGYESVGKMVAVINEREQRLGRKPTIVFYKDYEKGEHLRTNALPGMKYWSLQSGMTDEMFRQFKEDLFSKKPDFVITSEEALPERKELEEGGYRLVLIYTPIYSMPGQNFPNSCLYMFDHPK